MDSIIKSFEKYIYDAIGFVISSCNKVDAKSLPFFLLDEYNIYGTKILYKECVLLVSKTEKEVSPAILKKHVELIRDNFLEDVVFIHPLISSYNRKRLIEYKLPFVIPDNQMYLPDLMIDLREYFYAARNEKPIFSPTTQVVILYILNHFSSQPFIPSNLANRLGYSNTSMTRAFDEIETSSIGKIVTEGRQRCLWVHDTKRQFWEKSVTYLKSPVKRHIWIRKLPDELQKYCAGETALCHYSMLAPVRLKTFAAKKQDWDFYKSSDVIEQVKSKEDANFQLQIWSYAPNLFATDNFVDKFSLYMSLKDNEDERVQSAINDMMESIEW